jgi:hypothetical protein
MKEFLQRYVWKWSIMWFIVNISRSKLLPPEYNCNKKNGTSQWYDLLKQIVKQLSNMNYEF